MGILFSELGELKDHSIHYDRGGRSLGTAEVVYMRRADAEAALNRYNGVKLDGKPMKIEFVGVNVVTSYLLSPVVIGEVPDNSRSIWGIFSQYRCVFWEWGVAGSIHLLCTELCLLARNE
uniref:RRM domain-containing protein n=1 Tax=Kalanchoe fedtschenkoi TaxID=63787 RepID=A0A7N0TAJ3_KALFE